MSSALVIVDMQKQFYRGFGKVAMDRAQVTLNQLIERFRERGDPVVWIQHESCGEGLVPGREGFGIIDALSPLSNEAVIVKRRGNGFSGTGLETYLRQHSVDDIVVGGYAAEACVHKTYRGGLRLGFSAAKIRGGVASGIPLLLWLFDKIGVYRTADEFSADGRG